MNRKDLATFLFHFTIATILTWWFIIHCPLYISTTQILLSISIAGVKWLIQIIAGLIFLKDKAYIFLRKIGYVCFLGSCLLIPYILSAAFGVSNAPPFFFGSLVVSVLLMIFFYYKAMIQINLPLNWWLGWMLCLIIAIGLQITVVFDFLTF